MPKGLKITDDVIVTSDGKGLFLSDISTVVFGDLHIGFESVLLAQGTAVPTSLYPRIQKTILDAVEVHDASYLVINGDFKHEFSGMTYQEHRELNELYQELQKRDVALKVVRGNHDNFLINGLKKIGEQLHEPGLQLGRYFFTHGHKKVDVPTGSQVLIINHEHPAIELEEGWDIKHRFTCILFGEHDGKSVFVLPPVSPYSQGTPMNIPGRKVFSPMLAEMDLGKFVPIIPLKGELLIFPPLDSL